MGSETGGDRFGIGNGNGKKTTANGNSIQNELLYEDIL